MDKHWALVGLVWLSAVRDMTQLYSALIRESMQIDSALSQTAFCVTHRCPEQHAPRLNAVPDSMQLCSALSMTACAVWLRAVLDSMKLDTVLSQTACSLTPDSVQLFIAVPGQGWVKAKCKYPGEFSKVGNIVRSFDKVRCMGFKYPTVYLIISSFGSLILQ